MPLFLFNKLVRDRLVEEFVRMGQIAIYRPLTHENHIEALKQKIIEEANEIPVKGTKNEIIAEIADVQQAIDDLMQLNQISPQDVSEVKRAKLIKKGGFLSGKFVATIEIKDDDEWLKYYRLHPDIFPEVVKSGIFADIATTVESGTYQHYKGKCYQVIGVGSDTETEEKVVVYRPLYESEVSLWVRPYRMFVEDVVIDGVAVPRFKKIDK